MSRLGCRHKLDSADRELAEELGLLDCLARRFACACSLKWCIEKLNLVIDAGMSGGISGRLLGVSPW